MGDLRNRQAQIHSADDRSAWMLEIPAFQFSRFPEVAVIGEFQNAALHCGRTANWQLIGVLPCALQNKSSSRIPVQTAAKKWTTQACSCAQRKGAKFGTLTKRVTLHRCYPFQKALNASTCERRTRTPAVMMSERSPMCFSPGTISSAEMRQ